MVQRSLLIAPKLVAIIKKFYLCQKKSNELSNNFLRHRFLIERLRTAPHSLEDFEDDLAYSGEYTEVKPFSKRTLQRDIKDIREIYHIDIQYNKSIKKYEIVEDNDLLCSESF